MPTSVGTQQNGYDHLCIRSLCLCTQGAPLTLQSNRTLRYASLHSSPFTSTLCTIRFVPSVSATFANTGVSCNLVRRLPLREFMADDETLQLMEAQFEALITTVPMKPDRYAWIDAPDDPFWTLPVQVVNRNSHLLLLKMLHNISIKTDASPHFQRALWHHLVQQVRKVFLKYPFSFPIKLTSNVSLKPTHRAAYLWRYNVIPSTSLPQTSQPSV